MKYGDITQVFEKIDTKKRNTYDQNYRNTGNTLSIHQMGYRKGNSQHSLIRMLEKWKKNLDKPGKCSALFVDLSKAFYCL